MPKIAGFAALLRVLGFVLPQGIAPRDGFIGLGLSDQVPVLLWFLAALTMFLGNLLALWQNNLKRLLAERPCPVIVTCRREKDGGRWAKREDDRLMLLRQAIAQPDGHGEKGGGQRGDPHKANPQRKLAGAGQAVAPDRFLRHA